MLFRSAEVVDLLDNLIWFRTPSSYRLYDTDGGETINSTISNLNWATGHYEWREGGGGDPDNGTYNSGTGGDYVNIGDVEAGVWINGVMIRINNPGGDYLSFPFRRVQVRRGTGAVWTETTDLAERGDFTNKRTGFHLHGLGVFDATTDRVEVRGQTTFGTLDVVRDRRWGLRFGSATVYNSLYAAARPTSATQQQDWYNNVRRNQLRIESRLSAQRYKTGSNQSLTAATEALVTMGETDWSTHASMAPGASFPNLVISQQSGLYFVQAQCTHLNYDSGGSFVALAIKRNATSDIVKSFMPECLTTSTAVDTTSHVCDLVSLPADDYISAYATSGTASTVHASRGTHITATMMSSDDGVSSGRQRFAQLPPTAEWPDVAAMSSERLPLGTMRTISDLTDRCWHRPAFKAEMSDDTDIDSGGGWTDIDLDTPLFDYTSLEATHGVRVFQGGGLVLPWPGLWMVGGRLQISQRSSEGPNVGSQGHRGVRIVTGKNVAAGEVISAAMNASTHSWTRTLAETVVFNADDLEVRLQGLVGGLTDDGASVPAVAGHIWAVEVGDGITRVPR